MVSILKYVGNESWYNKSKIYSQRHRYYFVHKPQAFNLLIERWIQSSAGLHGSHRKFAIVFLSSSAESRECLICDTGNGEQCVEYADNSFSKRRM